MTIFQTPEYREIYRQIFGRGKRFHEIKSGENTIWLQSRGAIARRLEFWGQGIADVGDASLQEPENLPQLWAKIEQLTAQHHGAQWAQIPADSPLVELAKSTGWNCNPAEVCPVLALPASFEDYARGLGKNMREQIRRYPKRLEKQFSVEYELAQTAGQVETALDDLFRLHGKRWRARGQTGVLALPSRQKFHRAICHKFLENNWLRLWTLRCDGAPACVLLFYASQNRYSFFIGGFEPDLMKWSVGTCLFARVFQAAIEENATEIDFLRGAESYKYRFGAIDQNYVHLSWFSASPRGVLLQKRVALESEIMRRVHEKFSAAEKDK